MPVDVETQPPTVEQLREHYTTMGATAKPPGRPRKVYAPAEFPGPKGYRCPVYATLPGSRGYVRWPSVLDCARAMDVHYNTIQGYLDHPTAKLRGLRLSRGAPPASEAEIRAEEDRLAEFKVNPGRYGIIGSAVLAAREAVARRKEQQP